MFRGRFHRENDSSLVVLMLFVVKRIPANSLEALDRRILEFWRNPWEIYGPGCIDMKLDQLLQTPQDVRRLRFLLLESEKEFSLFGKSIPADILNSLVKSSDWKFGDFPVDRAIAASSDLRELIEQF